MALAKVVIGFVGTFFYHRKELAKLIFSGPIDKMPAYASNGSLYGAKLAKAGFAIYSHNSDEGILRTNLLQLLRGVYLHLQEQLLQRFANIRKLCKLANLFCHR